MPPPTLAEPPTPALLCCHTAPGSASLRRAGAPHSSASLRRAGAPHSSASLPGSAAHGNQRRRPVHSQSSLRRRRGWRKAGVYNRRWLSALPRTSSPPQPHAPPSASGYSTRVKFQVEK